MFEKFYSFVVAVLGILFPQRKLPRYLLISGLGLLALGTFGGLWDRIVVVFPSGFVRVDGAAATAFAEDVQFGAFWIGVIFLAIGLVLSLIEFSDDRKANNLKSTVALEIRGLRNVNGKPLKDVVPKRFRRPVHELVLDLRNRLEDGHVRSPDAILKEMEGLPKLKRALEGSTRGHVQTVIGGLAPVPFTFLVGVLLDDEDEITLMDWDRNRSQWRELDDADDLESFAILGADGVDDLPKEVAVAISCSYQIREVDVQATLPNSTIFCLNIPSCNSDNHWSDAKQARLGSQFLDFMKSLQGRGVEVIHLFLACQSSIALRLGRLYDKRNLPSLKVYQFERGNQPPFPWAVHMPVGGQETATIVDLRTPD